MVLYCSLLGFTGFLNTAATGFRGFRVQGLGFRVWGLGFKPQTPKLSAAKVPCYMLLLCFSAALCGKFSRPSRRSPQRFRV